MARKVDIVKIIVDALSVLASLSLAASLFFPFLSLQSMKFTLGQLLISLRSFYSLGFLLWPILMLAAVLNLALCLVAKRHQRGFLQFLLFEILLLFLIWTGRGSLLIISQTMNGGIGLSTLGLGAVTLAVGLIYLLLSSLILMYSKPALMAVAMMILIFTGTLGIGYYMNWFDLLGPGPRLLVRVEQPNLGDVPSQPLRITIANLGGRKMKVYNNSSSSLARDEYVLGFKEFDESTEQWKDESPDKWTRRLSAVSSPSSSKVDRDEFFHNWLDLAGRFCLFPVSIEPGKSVTFQRVFSPIWRKVPGEKLMEESESGRYEIFLENFHHKQIIASFEITPAENPQIKIKDELVAARALYEQRDYRGAMALLESITKNYPNNPSKDDIAQLYENCQSMLEKMARESEGRQMLAQARNMIAGNDIESAQQIILEVISQFEGLDLANEARVDLNAILEKKASALLEIAQQLEEQGSIDEAMGKLQEIVQLYPDTPTVARARERIQVVQGKIDQNVAREALENAKTIINQDPMKALSMLAEIETRYSHTSSFAEASRLASMLRVKEEFTTQYRFSGFITVGNEVRAIVKELHAQQKSLQLRVGDRAGDFVVKEINKAERLLILEKNGIQFDVRS